MQGTASTLHGFVWRNSALPRVKVFGWLFVKERTQCKLNLLHKHIVDDATCDLCNKAEESPYHIVVCCSFAAFFWNKLGGGKIVIAPVDSLWSSTPPDEIPTAASSTFVLLCCWKHCHDVVLRSLQPNLQRLLQSCRHSTMYWRCRLPENPKRTDLAWCSLFRM